MTSHSIPWTDIRTLSFDIYGTLVDWNKGILVAARATALGPFLPSNDNEVLKIFGKHAADLEHNQPSMRKADINTEALLRCASDLKIVEGGKISQEEVEKAAKEFGKTIGDYEIFPDTINALHRLKHHYKLIALSNIDHTSLNATLTKQFGGNPFDACYIAEDIGTYKPNLNNFNYLLEHMKKDFDIDQGKLCHVAQSLFHDHPATKQMGIRSVWLDRYDILASRGRAAEDMQMEFGYKLRVTGLAELGDRVERAFGEGKS